MGSLISATAEANVSGAAFRSDARLSTLAFLSTAPTLAPSSIK
jgi:hypothetical protein